MRCSTLNINGSHVLKKIGVKIRNCHFSAHCRNNPSLISESDPCWRKKNPHVHTGPWEAQSAGDARGHRLKTHAGAGNHEQQAALPAWMQPSALRPRCGAWKSIQRGAGGLRATRSLSVARGDVAPCAPAPRLRQRGSSRRLGEHREEKDQSFHVQHGISTSDVLPEGLALGWGRQKEAAPSARRAADPREPALVLRTRLRPWCGGRIKRKL